MNESARSVLFPTNPKAALARQLVLGAIMAAFVYLENPRVWLAALTGIPLAIFALCGQSKVRQQVVFGLSVAVLACLAGPGAALRAVVLIPLAFLVLLGPSRLVAELMLGGFMALLVFQEGASDAFGVAVAIPLGLLLLFGPSRFFVAGFVVFMIVSHQFRSFALFPAGGILWHPRELLLFAALAHWGAKLMRGETRIPADPLHIAFVLYGLFFIEIGMVGLLHEPDLHRIVAECRYPMFLASYLLFISFVRERKDLDFYIGIVFALSLVIAVAGIGFFVYTFVSGNVVNTQNALGEYVRREIGPLLLQSVRPNGHMFFEVSLVVLASLIFCPGIGTQRRAIYLALMGIFGLAVAITMMRTAYVALLISLCFLVWLSLPNWRVQSLAIALGAALVLIVAVFFGDMLHAFVDERMADMGASIKGRLVEIEGAWRVFKEHPIVGTGMGGAFEGFGFVSKTSQLAYGQATFTTVHNVWMYYLFKGGLVGFLLVVLASAGIFARGYSIIPTIRDARDRFLLRGLVAALGGQLAASLAMPRLTYPIGYVFISMIACVFVVLAKDNPPHLEAPGPGPASPPKPNTVPDAAVGLARIARNC